MNSTNQEAHVSDFATAVRDNLSSDQGPLQDTYRQATRAINDALQRKLYPLVRKAFPKAVEDCDAPLFIYDALVIRYNATTVDNNTTTATTGAGQPLHRDLGLVSINIMLNEPTDFEGGGTFFEDQLLSTSMDDNTLNSNNNNDAPSPVPIKPLGVGHAILHESSRRHAGAATTAGVRDILVLFVSAAAQAPDKIKNARLKTMTPSIMVGDGSSDQDTTTSTAQLQQRIQHQLLHRIRRQRLAVEMVPSDGEAHQYLGSALMEYAQFLTYSPKYDIRQPSPTAILDAAIQCFDQAKGLTVCDARVYNNLGIAHSRKADLFGELNTGVALAASSPGYPNKHQHQDPRTREQQRQSELQLAEAAYRQGYRLLQQFQCAGCHNMEQERRALHKNYGLFVSRQDRFEEACHILEEAANKYSVEGSSEESSDSTTRDCYELWKYCRHRINEQCWHG